MVGFLPFLGVSTVVITTPGQDTALTIRNTLLGGRAGGLFTAVGVTAGQVTWTLAASTGAGALLAASEPAFAALKLAGSAYLVFLGARALLGAMRSRDGRALSPAKPTGARLLPVSALRQGLLSNLGNPKMLAFFASLLPQFASSFSGLLVLGLVFCSLTFIWLTAYTFAVARAAALLRRPRLRRLFEALTGTALIALALRLAADRRW
jgi:threonine/homoserine/homoserine lactone efflux protein